MKNSILILLLLITANVSAQDSVNFVLGASTTSELKSWNNFPSSVVSVSLDYGKHSFHLGPNFVGKTGLREANTFDYPQFLYYNSGGIKLAGFGIKYQIAFNEENKIFQNVLYARMTGAFNNYESVAASNPTYANNLSSLQSSPTSTAPVYIFDESIYENFESHRSFYTYRVGYTARVKFLKDFYVEGSVGIGFSSDFKNYFFEDTDFNYSRYNRYSSREFLLSVGYKFHKK